MSHISYLEVVHTALHPGVFLFQFCDLGLVVVERGGTGREALPGTGWLRRR